jgi:hypothetical protein
MAEGVGDRYFMHHATKTYGEVEVSNRAFVSWVLDGTDWSAAHR